MSQFEIIEFDKSSQQDIVCVFNNLDVRVIGG